MIFSKSVEVFLLTTAIFILNSRYTNIQEFGVGKICLLLLLK